MVMTTLYSGFCLVIKSCSEGVQQCGVLSGKLFALAGSSEIPISTKKISVCL